MSTKCCGFFHFNFFSYKISVMEGYIFSINCLEFVGGAGATFDWTFFDNSKLINFDD